MVEDGLVNLDLDYHRECLRFCFIGILQGELDETVRLWNNHRIRRNYYAVCPSGRPDTLYYAPERSGGQKCGKQITLGDLDLAEEQVDRERNLFECSPEFIELCQILMTDERFEMPTGIETAKTLALFLINQIDMM